MMRIILALTIMIHATASFAQIKDDMPKELAGLSLINGCSIYTPTGFQQAVLPGNICLFMDDGSFYTATDESIRHISVENAVKWEIKGHFHHQVNFSTNKDKILALSSEIIEHQGLKQRADKFMVISLDGKILHQQTSAPLLEKFGLPALRRPSSPQIQATLKVDHEMSHFNSFYEIPQIKLKNPPAYLKKGNFVVNSLWLGVFFLSHDLSQVLHHYQNKFSLYHNVHDVQITGDGTLLLFNNVSSESKRLKNFSTIQEIDLLNNRPVFEFKAKPEEMFFSQYCGGVQSLNADLLLFSDHMNATYLFSRKQNMMLYNIPGTHQRGFEHKPTQQVKAQDLQKFMTARFGAKPSPKN
jgi:hypothetical protein